MKTLFVRHSSSALAAGLILFLGCARPSAQPEQPKAVAAPIPPPPVVVQNTAESTITNPAGTNASAFAAGTNGPAIEQRIPPTPQPQTVQLSPALAEIVKLVQAGVGEEVILTYIEKSSERFNVGADQIVYLSDLGVSSGVLTSMLKHDGASDAVIAATLTNQPPESLVQAQPVSNPPANQTVIAAPQSIVEPQPATVTAPNAPPPSTEVNYYYDALSPYGSWLYVSGYGWCWQPTVAVVTSTWSPYCDRGRWYWSDAGWYWHSDYTWGWAPFHYGRWYRHPHSGWLWTPGVVWGPSWVSWRYADGYCGWAPLPPEAHFVHGVGFTYYGHHVSVGFEFGLGFSHYTFVSAGRFCDYSPYRHAVPHANVRNVYRNSTVINNYIVGNNNTIINNGVGRETIARVSQTPVRQVAVREAPVRGVSNIRGDRLEKQGNQLVVYRPQLPKTPPARPAAFANRVAVAGENSRVAGRAANTSGGNVAVPSTSQPITSSRTGGGVRREAVEPRGETVRPGTQVPGVQPRDGRPVESRTVPGTSPSVTPQERRIERNTEAPARQRTEPAPAPSRQPQQPRSSTPLFAPSAGSSPAQQGASVAARSEELRTVNPQAAPRTQQAPQVTPRAQGQAQVTARPQNSSPYNSPMIRTYPPAASASQAPVVRNEGRSEYRAAGRAAAELPSHAAPQQFQGPRYNPGPANNVPAQRIPQPVAPSPSYSRPAAAQSSAPAAPRVERQSRSESAPSGR